MSIANDYNEDYKSLKEKNLKKYNEQDNVQANSESVQCRVFQTYQYRHFRVIMHFLISGTRTSHQYTRGSCGHMT